MTAYEVGDAVWPGGNGRKGRVSAGTGGGDYAALMLLGRLRNRGLVAGRTPSGEGSTRWYLTAAGMTRVHEINT